ncbi:MAG: NAD(P)-dependent oxidoreductase [Ignavibacteriaceae bacterium]
MFLITGATGRLGAELTKRLEELGAYTIPLVTPGYPDRPERINWQSTTRPIRLEEIDLDRIFPDYVINLHWRVNRELSFARQLLYETDFNIYRLEKLWDMLRFKQIENFVNISSIKVFGENNSGELSAVTEPKPDSPYGIAKLAAENFFDYYFNSYFPVNHLRLCSVASAGEHPSQLMSRLFNSAFQNEKIRINSDQITYLLFIEEAVDLIISAAVYGKKLKYNLIPEGLSNKVIAELFEELSGRKLNADYISSVLVKENKNFKSDISKFKRDWVRSYSIQETITKIINLNRNKSPLLSERGAE